MMADDLDRYLAALTESIQLIQQYPLTTNTESRK